MLITPPNADFSGSGLGKVTRMIGGVPAANLLGLYGFQDGADGDTIETVLDLSGNGNHATPRANWPQRGIQRSYGMEVPTNEGVCYQTPIDMQREGQQLTMFFVGRHHLPGSETSVYNNILGASDNSGMSLPTDNHNNQPALTVNVSGHNSTQALSVYDNSADMMGQTNLGVLNEALVGEIGAGAMIIDGAESTVRLVTASPNGTGDGEVTNAPIGAFYDGVTDLGTIEFGPWPHASNRSATQLIAETHLVAIYDTAMTATQAQEHMAFMRKIIVARGVTGW